MFLSKELIFCFCLVISLAFCNDLDEDKEDAGHGFIQLFQTCIQDELGFDFSEEDNLKKIMFPENKMHGEAAKKCIVGVLKDPQLSRLEGDIAFISLLYGLLGLEDFENQE